MLPRNFDIQRMIRREAAKGMAVAELEYLGVSYRTINTLEEKVGIVYLKQLINKTEEELLNIEQLGSGAIEQIIDALERFPELESERKRWHQGSERTDYYKTRTNIKAILS